MLFVSRDASGAIRAVYDRPREGAGEELPIGHPELLAFVLRHREADIEAVRQALTGSDLAMVRILEDLVELLVAKHIVLFTELPHAAQRKLLERRAVRERLHACEGLMVGERDIL